MNGQGYTPTGAPRKKLPKPPKGGSGESSPPPKTRAENIPRELTPEQREIFMRLKSYSKPALAEWLAIVAALGFPFNPIDLFRCLDALDKSYIAQEYQYLLKQYDSLLTPAIRNRAQNNKSTKSDITLIHRHNRVVQRLKTLKKKLHL